MGKTNIRKYFHYLFLYCTISYGGMALPNYIGGNDLFSLMMFLVSSIIIIRSKLQIKTATQYFIFISIFALLLLSIFATSTLSLGSIYTIISILIVIYASYIYNPLKYIQRILLILFVLSIISICLFSIQSFIGTIILPLF